MIDLSIKGATELIADIRGRDVGGRMLLLGTFNCLFSFNQLIVAMSKHGMIALDGRVATVSPREKAVVDEFQTNGRRHSGNADEAGNPFITDEFFFRFIGFDSVIRVDHTEGARPNGGGAAFAFDLNEPGLADIAGRHDLVFDAGTMERAYNTPNVLRNIFDALSIGGHVFHRSATNNCVDSGYYQFSPRFFLGYYTSNDYGDVEVYLNRTFGPGKHTLRTEVENLFHGVPPQEKPTPLEHRARYTPGSLDEISPGGFDGGVYTTSCFAKKLVTSTFDRAPGARPEHRRLAARAE